MAVVFVDVPRCPGAKTHRWSRQSSLGLVYCCRCDLKIRITTAEPENE